MALPKHYDVCTNGPLGRSYKRLALKHSPRYFPNDLTAPFLSEKITKAYSVLIDPDRRLFYDAHGNVPVGLEGFGITLLRK